jgi:hypothetical protein
MGKTVMGAVVSLDGFIADDNDAVGPLFDWLANGDVTWSFPGSDDEFRTTQASADFMRSYYRDVAAVVIGRRLFDMTNGWNGKPAAGEHVFVVTHQPPTDWEHADRQPGSGGLRLRPAVLCNRSPGRAAAVGEPDHDSARRPGHPPGLRRQPLRLVVVSSCRPSRASALREVALIHLTA